MPILSTNRGHIDEERVRTIIVRLLESLGKNEKSIWEHYNEMAVVEDNIREVEWRDLADTILVFDGLFAAFLSAFLVFTIPQLQPNSTDVAMDVLIHISQQLSNSTTPAYAPTEFTVSPTIAAVNVLFFISLGLVLIDAFLAMLVKSWLQEFDCGWKKYTVADLRAQEWERRLRGLERWKLAELVALLPILIQASHLFFGIGLLILLFPIHRISFILSCLGLVAGLTFYGFTIYVSILDVYAPFSSPVSRGLTILINALRTTSSTLGPLIARNVHRTISGVSFRVSRDPLPRQHREDTDPSAQPSPRRTGVVRPSLPQVNDKREVVTRSHSQIDSQTYVDVLERLFTRTAEAVENIPVFLELLDQPVKDPMLRPSNVEKWKRLLDITLGLLGEPSTFSDSAARIIARTVLFCYDDSESADKQLSRRLIYHFDHMGSGQKDKYKPLNSLFSPYLQYYCNISPHSSQTVTRAVASLEPSDAADAELLWMVNTIHKNLHWRRPGDPTNRVFEFFAAVLTYVSSTEQSRRSQVPLTAAIIYAMHTIQSALKTSGIGSIDGPYLLPGTVTTSESMFVTVHQANALDLWSDHCIGLASALLQPCSLLGVGIVWKFQLALMAALYIDSTKQAGHASTAFAHLLKLTNFPDITITTWGWADAYDRTKLAGYSYMAIFQEPIYQDYSKNSPFQDIGTVVEQTIERCSEMKLSVLHLLDISVKHLFIRWTALNVRARGFAGPFNPWILLHLETLFSQNSVFHLRDFEQLEWADTPEQIYIAKARLALYDSLQGEGHKETTQLKPDPHLLKLFLRSKDYTVCTCAFKWCLNLATINQHSPAGDIHSAGMFIPETMGCQWIEHLIQVLCKNSRYAMVRSWEFLAEHLAPKWAMLPPSWCCDFASVFLFPNLHSLDMDEPPAYQQFSKALRDWEKGRQINQAFLSFLGAMLELIEHSLNQDQLTSLETWLTQLPEILENQDAYVKMENILATRKQQIADETLGFFAELPMRYPDWMNDIQ